MATSHRCAAWLLFAAVLGGCGADPIEGDVGAIRITVTTSGASLDPDGYTIAIGDHPAEPITRNGEKRVGELRPGPYAARLGGMASNCYAEERNPTSVQVTAGAVATVAFHVVCSLAGAAVRVTIQTGGQDLDSDGYLLTIGSATPQHLPVSGIANLTVREEGQLALELSGLAPNCTADPANPSTVSIAEGVNAPISLKVNCAVSTGAIRFTLALSGEDVQLGGFTAYLDYQPVTLISAGAVVRAQLAPGEHSIYLDTYTIQANCAITGINPNTVVVELGDTTDVVLDVACTRLAHLTISVTTTGEDRDTDGYELTLYYDDYYRGTTKYMMLLPAAGMVLSPGMLPGAYQPLLDGVPANCRLAASTTIPILVSTEDAEILFVIDCQRRP